MTEREQGYFMRSVTHHLYFTPIPPERRTYKKKNILDMIIPNI